MNNIAIIFKKELTYFFNNRAAYIVLITFSLISGWFFTNTFFLINESDLRGLFSIIPIIFLFFVPAITMGLIARESNSGTLEFLTTLPFSDSQIILGKYLAAVALIVLGLVITLVHFISLLFVGINIDLGALFSGYLGLILVSAVYAAIGIFGSTITNNQITAFIISFMIIFIVFILDKVLFFLPGFLATIFQFISIDYHLNNISRGVIDTRNLIYFGSMICFFLMVSIRFLEIRKWR